jgi:transmembrane sensor
MKPEITKDLLFANFGGQLNAQQRRLIDEWALQPQNEELYYKYLMEWEATQLYHPADLAAGIERFRERIEESTPVENAPGFWQRFRAPLAAACLLMLLSGAGYIFRDNIRYKQLSTGAGEVRSWTLEDGSRVSLNANSKLTVPRFGFGKDTRDVVLIGEAEFAVTHQADNQRFVVKATNGVDIVVLGTEFAVYSRTDKTQILLNKGKVRVVRKSGNIHNATLMAPGDKVVVDHGRVETKRFDAVSEYATWKESRFVFSQTSLTEVARLLENNYNLKVSIAAPELSELTVSGSFKAENHEELIQSISQILGIQYVIKGKQVKFIAAPAE